jgi:hypothetical protein
LAATDIKALRQYNTLCSTAHRSAKMAIQIFNKDQLHLISKGSIHRQTLRNQIDEALNANPFNENYIISSLPGLGKTWELEQALQKMSTPPLVFNGENGIYSYTVDVATAVYLAKGQRIVVVNDDCDMLFENKVIGTTKKMFDNTRILRYGKNYKSLKPICTELQFEALESFARPDRAGLDIPLHNVTFITLTNMHLHTVDEVEAHEQGSPKYDRYNSLYSIRRRTEYKEIDMPLMELWGYVADVVLNDKICEKFIPNISQQHKEQILLWCYTQWQNGITERNLSIIEKMTKMIARYPNDYLDIWNQEYVSK